jgi:hypothetical protein
MCTTAALVAAVLVAGQGRLNQCDNTNTQINLFTIQREGHFPRQTDVVVGCF